MIIFYSFPGAGRGLSLDVSGPRSAGRRSSPGAGNRSKRIARRSRSCNLIDFEVNILLKI